MGADVVLISGPVSEPFPSGVEVQAIESAGQMLAAVERALPADIGIFAAAVADWRVDDTASDKIKKTPSGPPHLKLVENPDILRTIAGHAQRPAVLVGFAAETDNVVAHARKKLSAKGCDLIAANDVRPETGVMGGERTRLILVDAAGEELLPDLLKHEAAVTVLERAASLLEGRSSAVSA
jgi:phosphopantothenoylcysteine decarboxylase/phosphopantothenate--cysteine ligase